MAVIREADWIDCGTSGAAPFEALLARVASGDYTGRCILCGAEHPHDVKWPCFAIEVERKADGASSGDIEMSACPSCEPRLDALMDSLA